MIVCLNPVVFLALNRDRNVFAGYLVFGDGDSRIVEQAVVPGARPVVHRDVALSVAGELGDDAIGAFLTVIGRDHDGVATLRLVITKQ